MKHLNSFQTRAAAVAAVAAALCGAASAQSLLTDPTATTVIATDTDAAPGCPGDSFGGSSALGDTPYLDGNGNVAFRGRLTGVASTSNERALFLGATRAGLNLVIRNSDPAPGLPGLVLLYTSTTSNFGGVGANVRQSENGRMFFGSYVNSGATANDTAYFAGFPGSFQVLAREGDPAPGIAGATMTGAFNNPSGQSTGMNDAGDCFFQTSLAGAVTSADNAVWYLGQPGSLAIAQRKGDTVLGGAVISALGFVSQINPAGQFLHDESLSTTLGSLPATTLNDKCLFIYTPGFGNTLVVRESDPAPGTVGATFNAWGTGGVGIGTGWSVNVAGNAFTNAGALVYCDLYGGDAVYGLNDKALYLGSTSGMSLLVRRNDIAPGTFGASFGAFSPTGFSLSPNGRIMFRCLLQGAGVTTSNDEAIFEGFPGSFNLVVREGDPVPGSGGTLTFAGMISNSSCHNAFGQVTWEASLLPGNVSARWSWDPVMGLKEVCRAGDSLEVQTGVFKSITSTGSFTGAFNNGNGAQGCLSNDGRFTMSIPFTDNTRAIVAVKIPHAPAPVNYCTAGTTTNGCNALISGAGIPSATAGSGFTLSVTGAEGGQTGIVFYGLAPLANPWGTGSSFMCVKAPVERTGVQNLNGTSGLCDGTMSLDWNAFIATTPGAVGTPFVGGESVYAQGWFRDPPAPKTTSLSDAIQFTVQP